MERIVGHLVADLSGDQAFEVFLVCRLTGGRCCGPNCGAYATPKGCRPASILYAPDLSIQDQLPLSPISLNSKPIRSLLPPLRAQAWPSKTAWQQIPLASRPLCSRLVFRFDSNEGDHPLAFVGSPLPQCFVPNRRISSGPQMSIVDVMAAASIAVLVARCHADPRAILGLGYIGRGHQHQSTVPI